MCGGIGGLFMNLIAGGMLQWLGSYTPLFIFGGLMHPLAWIMIRVLSRGNIEQVDLSDSLLQAPESPVLRRLGTALTVVGLGLGALVWSNWENILAATKRSTAAAAGGLSSAGMLALLGLALIYASRPQRAASTAAA
jgi:hypothetical protein